MTRLAIAGVLVGFTFTCAAAAAAAAAADNRDLPALLRRLASDDAVDFRIAQAMFAREGHHALPALDAAAERADDRLRPRLKELVALMLLRSVDLAEMRKHPRLMALPEPEFKAAADVARSLAGAKDYDSGELPPLPPGPRPPPTAAREAVSGLVAMGGYAVPAALELARDHRPESRMYGAEVLLRSGAEGQIGALMDLSQESVPVTIPGGDVMRDSTVGAEVMDWLRRTHPFVRRFSAYPVTTSSFEAEQYLIWLDRWQRPKRREPQDSLDLINRLRQDAKTTETDSFVDYWRRVRPILREIWKAPAPLR